MLLKTAVTTAITTAIVGLGLFGAHTHEVEASTVQWEPRPLGRIQEEIDDGAEEYEVKYGDTLGVIAKALGTDVHTLANANGIEDIDLIFPGMVISKSTDATGEEEFEVQEQPEVVEEAPKEEPKEENTEVEETVVEEKPVTTTVSEVEPKPVTPSKPTSNSEAEAKHWIAMKESNDDYNAVNPTGKYIGKYQLTKSYLNGDHSPENQERVADEYVKSRYGSWVKAKEFWVQNGWY